MAWSQREAQEAAALGHTVPTFWEPDPLRSSAPGWGWRSAAIPLLFLLCPSLLLSGSARPSGRQKADEFGIFSGFQEEVLVVVPTGLVQAFQVSQL